MRNLNQLLLEFDYKQNFKDDDFYVGKSNFYTFGLFLPVITCFVFVFSTSRVRKLFFIETKKKVSHFKVSRNVFICVALVLS